MDQVGSNTAACARVSVGYNPSPTTPLHPTTRFQFDFIPDLNLACLAPVNYIDELTFTVMWPIMLTGAVVQIPIWATIFKCDGWDGFMERSHMFMYPFLFMTYLIFIRYGANTE